MLKRFLCFNLTGRKAKITNSLSRLYESTGTILSKNRYTGDWMFQPENCSYIFPVKKEEIKVLA